MATKKKKTTQKKRRLSFSKIVVLWVLSLTTASVIASYALSAFDKQTVESLSMTLITALAASIVTYCIKSLGEKASRNKYHLDENGNPIQQDDNNV